ncbi:alanine dehydrogenase [Aquibacillus sp. 3ASR75-11]|uniref:Alanine dehydrogenase n=1 Tax=Terrihalobacillus insolitus TaxID=2950438 RepID=A0A9X4AN43_9BACI|nr:alanine dehydrogenase [Terrihalobacillus insolitus]MDC3414058.1 alanine dehydrogenase [Terrihalobacillus insolitus]MDC3424148.1 alanine dehydrogenase [Terrihalobacillus insolitus]
MIIGIPKEMKNNENRVAITPAGITAFKDAGHEVWLEKSAGVGSGISDQEFRDAGAEIMMSPKDVWSADMVMKVKEPQLEEYQYFREGLILFTYLHLAAETELAEALLESKVISIAYETIQLDNGALPLLTPMSEVAGRMSVQIGAQFLEKAKGGKGTLLGGVPGVMPGNVVIIGGGIVGTNAAKMAIGLGANVTLLDINPTRLRELDNQFNGQINTVMSNQFNIAEAVKKADLLIGAVLIPGAKAPQLVVEDMVKTMEEGSVIVDVAIDQGGSIETANQISTHDNPTYVKHGVIHYAVANIPGAVSRTSTYALTNVTNQYGVLLANKGYKQAAIENKALAKGFNTMKGYVTHAAVAKALGLGCESVESLLKDVAVASS